MQVRMLDSSATSVAVNSVNDAFIIQVVDGVGAPVPDAAVALRMPDEGPTGFFSNGTRSDVVYTDAKGEAKFTQVHWGPNPGKAVLRVTVVKGALRAGALIEESIGATAVSLPAVAQNAAPPAPSAPPVPKVVAAKNKAPAVPGTPVSIATTHTGATSAAIPASSSSASDSGGVSVTNTSASNSGAGQSGSSKKWIIIAAVAAGAGVGAALALSGHHGSTTTTPGLTIGSPTLSVGH